MKATIGKPMILKAAATLANGGYNASTLQFERIGDKLRICGTNGYVMALATVDASFSRWAEGEGFKFNGAEVQAMMRGISKALKNAGAVTIEVTKGAALVTMDVEGAPISAGFQYEHTGKVISLSGIEDACQVEPGDDSSIALGSYFLGLASNAMKTISGTKYAAWTFKDHGASRPVEFISKDEPVRVLLMANTN